MDRYAVIGNPIKHSKSPLIHAAFAKQTDQDLTYIAIESPVNSFTGTIKDFEAAGGKGTNVTLPFKKEAFALADEHSDHAQQAQAANTLVFKDGKIYADNTDGPGLVQDLKCNHDYSLRQKHILVLGAGGATQGILGPLLAQAPAHIFVANRTPEKAFALAEQFEMHGDIDGIGLNDIEKKPYDLIINATSASVTGSALDIPKEIISEHTWCYDLFYADEPTAFLTFAKQQGAKNCIDGLGMLVEQAAGAFYLWRGVYPETKSVIALLKTGNKQQLGT